MSPVSVKEEYRVPSQILEKERERLGLTKPHTPIQVSGENLIGTWVNVNHETRDLLRVMIGLKANEITVHAFGACQPNPCDWGQVIGKLFAETVASVPGIAFVAPFKFEFAEITLTGHLYQGAMFIESFTHFTDHSGRADYYSVDVMSK